VQLGQLKVVGRLWAKAGPANGPCKNRREGELGYGRFGPNYKRNV
jgi:hypothetical protein